MKAETITPTRPLLRYHGGKWRLAPHIIKLFPGHRCYVEPYGGAASVLLRKPPSYAEIYNDLDSDVVNLFQVLRHDGNARKLVEQLFLTPFARDEFVSAGDEGGDPVEQARQLIIRSFMGFGSDSSTGAITGFRSNSNRSGSTPAHDWANYPDALKVIVSRLNGVVIESRPALHIMEKFDREDTLFYVDPPYVHETRSHKRKSYRHEMTDQDHEELVDVLMNLKGSVVLSGYSHPIYNRLADWKSYLIHTHADGARPREEVVWVNERAQSGQIKTLFGDQI